MDWPAPCKTLDVRTTKCPLNFVKARLALEKLAPGEVLAVWLDPASESVLNLPNSTRQEGHEVQVVENAEGVPDACTVILIKKAV